MRSDTILVLKGPSNLENVFRALMLNKLKELLMDIIKPEGTNIK